ncbi:MAG: light-harvesting protein, partial [Methyloversatilis sp. 12-65-5]
LLSTDRFNWIEGPSKKPMAAASVAMPAPVALNQVQ